MSSSIQSETSDTKEKSQPLRIIYAACGLVYRSGCGPSEHMISLAREIGGTDGVELTVLFAHAADPIPSGPYRIETLGDPGLESKIDEETDALVFGVNPFRYFAHRRKVKKYSKSIVNSFDCVIERMWGFGGIISKVFKVAGKQIIIEENGPISWTLGKNKLGDWVRKAYLNLSRYRLRRIYRLARTVVVQTSNLADRLIRDFKVLRQRIEVIPNGVNLARFQNIADNRSNEDDSPLILVYCGTLDDDHDLTPLCKAVSSSSKNIALKIIGSGSHGKTLKAIADKTGDNKIRLLGRIHPDKVVEYLAGADLCVAPYSSEAHEKMGFQYSPLKLLEYAAAGRAIAAAGAVPSKDAARSDLNCFFLANESARWLELIENLPARKALLDMGRKGRELVRDMGWNRTASKYMDIVQRRKNRVVVAPLPFSNPENLYIKKLHLSIEDAGAKIIDPGNLTLRWLFKHAGIVDFIHLHWPESHYQFQGHIYSLLKWFYFFLRIDVAKILRFKLVFTAHNLRAHDKKMLFCDRWIRNYLFRKSGTVLLGEGTSKAIRKLYSIPPTSTSMVIPHGNYIHAYGPIQDKNDCKRKLELPSDSLIYLFFGAIRDYKGLDILIRLFSRMDHQKSVLVVAGKDAEKKISHEIQTVADTDSARIRFFPGFIPDENIPQFLGAADYVVLPYKSVHMSGAALLALSYSRPVIAPRLGLIPEYLPEDTGILYEPDDTDGLKNAILKSFEQDPEEMGANGLKFASTLSWNKIGEQHLNFYEKLL